MGDTCFPCRRASQREKFPCRKGKEKETFSLLKGKLQGKTRPYPMPEQRHSVSAALVGREGIAMGATIISGALNEQFSWAWGT